MQKQFNRHQEAKKMRSFDRKTCKKLDPAAEARRQAILQARKEKEEQDDLELVASIHAADRHERKFYRMDVGASSP